MEQTDEAACRLWSLPQELVDEIFSFAFPPDPDVKLVSIRQWKSQENYKHKADRAYKVRSITPKVNSFLVSKRFFLLAAQTYSSNQAWHTSSSNSGEVLDFPLLLHFACSIQPSRWSFFIDIDLLEVADIPSITTWALEFPARVFDQRVEEVVNDAAEYGEYRCPWQDEYSLEELERLPILTIIPKMRYVQAISLDFREISSYFWSDDFKTTYAKNVEALRQIFIKRFRQKEVVFRGEVETPSCCHALYVDSRVCGSCSLMHFPDKNMKRRAAYEREAEEETVSALTAAGLEAWNGNKIMPKEEENVEMLIKLRPEMIASWIARARDELAWKDAGT